MDARTCGAHWRTSAKSHRSRGHPCIFVGRFSWERGRERPERARLITGAVRDDNICRFRFSSSLFPISKSGRTRCPVKLLDYVRRIGEKRSQVAVSAWEEYARVLYNLILCYKYSIRYKYFLNITLFEYSEKINKKFPHIINHINICYL